SPPVFPPLKHGYGRAEGYLPLSWAADCFHCRYGHGWRKSLFSSEAEYSNPPSPETEAPSGPLPPRSFPAPHIFHFYIHSAWRSLAWGRTPWEGRCGGRGTGYRPAAASCPPLLFYMYPASFCSNTQTRVYPTPQTVSFSSSSSS